MASVTPGGAFTPVALEAALPGVVAAIPLDWLKARRWFGSKTREVRGVRLQDASTLAWDAAVNGGYVLALVVVEYGDGGAEAYGLPLAFQAASSRDSTVVDDATILEIAFADQRVRVSDALGVPAFGLRLWQLIRDNARLAAAHGQIVCEATGELDAAAPPARARVLGVEQSNTSVVYDDAWILKCYRKVVPGTSRDLEISRFFTAFTDFRQAPPLAGSIEYVADGQAPATLAMLQRFVPNRGDGWSVVLASLARWYRQRVGDTAGSREAVRASLGSLGAQIEQLGAVTGAMHRALGSRPDIAEVAPQPVRPEDVDAWGGDVRREAARAFAALRASGLAGGRELLRHEADYERLYQHTLDALRAVACAGEAWKIQIHGDFHLGQVLTTDHDWVVIDFEGEPARPLEERRAPQSPLKDVAGMLRSFSYAAHAGLRELDEQGQRERAGWAEAWEQAVSDAYLEGYLRTMAGSGLIPASRDDVLRFVKLFAVGKAFYELQYELNNRPDWVSIPLRGIERMLHA